MQKKIPLSIQSFKDLRERNCVYIDKTPLIYQLTQGGGKVYFLSRPRRFGKSMTLSTLKYLYQGQKELFEGLWIEDKWDWAKKNPVIHFSFSSLDYRQTPLEEVISKRLISIAKEFKISLKEESCGAQLEELIRTLREKQGKVVILIDEYDKPIIDYLEPDQHEKAKEHRNILRQFYIPIKDNGEHIELFFMTGVSKFSQTGI